MHAETLIRLQWYVLVLTLRLAVYTRSNLGKKICIPQNMHSRTLMATSSFAWFTRNNGTIQQTEDAVNVLQVYRHNSRPAAWPEWPTVILRFMETRLKTLALSTRNLWVN